MAEKNNVAEKQKVDPEKTFTFPKGIPGFETYTKFIIFHKEENDEGVYWFESLEEPAVTFTLIDPSTYGLSYELLLSDEEQKILEIEKPETAAILLLLSKSEDKKTGAVGIHANIAGPVVINVANRKGIQKVISKSSSKVSIVPE